MVNAKECDRCGKIYGETGGTLFKSMGIVDRDEEEVDLCRSCEEDLESFYNYEFEEIEEVKKLLKKRKK